MHACIRPVTYLLTYAAYNTHATRMRITHLYTHAHNIPATHLHARDIIYMHNTPLLTHSSMHIFAHM